ncbi:hypothetical protein SAMN05216410_0804 [Sanguibacter gelidistatuariae]|uniref:CopC domain-containing protein n=1 Tax=Sanguibacter gelidistatuariae TaxID=1814289 RepID=A0A1G6H755_9MICO|nr:copper resistance CopC family protein [Sanguibacter gelidistatuariae]SDB90119.1 hypothetical protein SAMN05216410_0804 [Sanguibacter gelidistatuariae]
MTSSAASLVPARRARLAPAALILALLTAAFAATGATLLASPAAAHDAIVSSDPADGAQLTTSPTQITLTFNEDVSDLGGQVVVTDSTGATVAAGAPAVTGPAATLPLADPLANGAYSVAWRAVSSDSHPIDGTFAFTVADPAAEPEPEPEMTALADAPTADDATPETATEETPTPIMATEPADEADDSTKEGLPWPGIIIGAVLGIGAGIAITVISKRRGRKD